MRIVTWNCNGKFREKYTAIRALNSDIYVIQECENPVNTKNDGYREFANNYIWVGYRNRGLGIFAKKTITLEDNHWDTFGLEWFISCSINKRLTLIGVWGCGNYIRDIYVYIQIYKKMLEKINSKIICGDFNSNCCWDNKNRIRTHISVVEQLEQLNLFSCYHLKEKEQQGEESKPTFYMYRYKEKPYHIDYMFYNNQGINNIEIGEFDDWISLSDHMPMILDINPNV